MRDDIVQQLNSPLPGDAVSKRQGPGGKWLDYIEGWYAIDNANRIFGYDGWSSEVISLTSVHIDRGVAYLAQVRVSVSEDGIVPTTHSDVGYGSGYEHELAAKEAVTDALKRCLRHWGDQFGNRLYDKDKLPPVMTPEHMAQGNVPVSADDLPFDNQPTYEEEQHNFPPPKEKLPGLSEKQVGMAYAVAKSAGIRREQLEEWVRQVYQLERVQDMDNDQLDAMLQRLRAKANA